MLCCPCSKFGGFLPSVIFFHGRADEQRARELRQLVLASTRDLIRGLVAEYDFTNVHAPG